MSDAMLALVAALGASALTGLSTLGVMWFQETKRAKADDADALGRAVIEFLARSLALAMRVRTIANAIVVRSGLGEGLDVALRVRKPLEVLEFHDWLHQDWAPLNAAWSGLWARGDQELVSSANILMTRCHELIDAATATGTPTTATAKARRIVVGEQWTPEQTAAIEEAMRAFGLARREFTAVARAKLSRVPIDLVD
jgi:hypothetical protein